MTLKEEGDRLLRSFLMPISNFHFLLNGILLFMWGLWVASPLWTVFNKSTTAEYLQIFPEPLWGMVAMIGGLIKLWGVRRNNEKALKIASYTGVLVWGTLATFYWAADWAAPGTIIMTYLFLNSAWHYLNLKVMQGENIL